MRSFSPTGRPLAGSSLRNTLKPLAAFWVDDTRELEVVFSRIGDSIMHRWNELGEHQSKMTMLSFDSGTAHPVNGNMLMQSGNTAQVLGLGGELIGEHRFEVNQEFDLSGGRWNKAGDLTAYFGNSGNTPLVRLFDNAGQVQRDLALPDGNYPTYAGVLLWSPDDRSLVLSIRTAKGEQQVYLWDLEQDSSGPSVSFVMGQEPPPKLAWSPDSQWLSVCSGNDQAESGTRLRFVHAPTAQFKDITIPSRNYLERHALEWYDARSVRVGGAELTLPADLGDEITTRDLGFTLAQITAALNTGAGREVLLATNGNDGSTRFEFWSNGERQASMPAPLVSNSQVAANPFNSKAVFFSGIHPDAFVQLDMASQTIDYLGIALDNGSTAKLSADGQILSPATGTDPYLSYVLRYPGGVEVAVTQEQFEQRESLDTASTNLQWIFDVGGSVQLAEGEAWISNRTDSANRLSLLPSEVVAIDLTRCQITEASLSRLASFPNLVNLDLSNTPIGALVSLPILKTLTQLNLQDTAVDSVEPLSAFLQLRSLNLKNSKIDSSVVATLEPLQQLESLDVSGTDVDRFLLLDIGELGSLQHINVSRTTITASDVEGFERLHPTIEVVRSP